MIEQTANSLFMFSPLAAKHAELYQQLLKGVRDYWQLGNRLVWLGEQAHIFRDFDKVREIGLVLSNLPVKSFQSIGHYFLALAANNLGNGDQQEARRLLERVAESAPARYRAKAMLSLAAVSADARDYEAEQGYYKEILKVDALSSTGIEAIRGMAILKSSEGYHRHAVRQLEQLLPIISHAPHYTRLACLNSYAVELSEVGRIEEAKNVSLVVVSSPLVRAYPEWQETYSEVNQKLHKRRSTVSISIPKPKAKPKTKPVVEPVEETSIATVIKFPKARASQFEGVEVPKLTPIEWLAVMLKVTYGDRSTDEEISRFCTAYFELLQGWDSYS